MRPHSARPSTLVWSSEQSQSLGLESQPAGGLGAAREADAVTGVSVLGRLAAARKADAVTGDGVLGKLSRCGRVLRREVAQSQGSDLNSVGNRVRRCIGYAYNRLQSVSQFDLHNHEIHGTEALIRHMSVFQFVMHNLIRTYLHRLSSTMPKMLLLLYSKIPA